MQVFVMQIAEIPFIVETLFDSTKEYFRDYLSNSEPLYSIIVTKDALVKEQALLDQEADLLGLRHRVFSEPFLERTVIMRKVAQFAVNHSTLLMHGSTIVVNNKAYLFTANTGVGKSTHVQFWVKKFGKDAVILNDDRAFLQISNAGIIAYGSPWCGKHGLGANIFAPLAGICILSRGNENQIFRADSPLIQAQIHDQIFIPDESQAAEIRLLTDWAACKTTIWIMSCTKEEKAADIAYQAMSQIG